jgi:hypothetical protein
VKAPPATSVAGLTCAICSATSSVTAIVVSLIRNPIVPAVAGSSRR